MSIPKIDINDTLLTEKDKINYIIDILNNSIDNNDNLNFISLITDNTNTITFKYNDTLILEAGNNINITLNELNKKITIESLSDGNVSTSGNSTLKCFAYFTDTKNIESFNALKAPHSNILSFGLNDGNGYFFDIKSSSNKNNALRFLHDDQLYYQFLNRLNTHNFYFQKYDSSSGYKNIFSYDYTLERLFLEKVKINNTLLTSNVVLKSSFDNIVFSEQNIIELGTHYSSLKFKARTSIIMGDSANDYGGFEFVLNVSDDGKFLVNGRAVRWIFDPTGYFGWFRVEWDEGDAGENVDWKRLFFIGNYQADFEAQRVSAKYFTMGQFLEIRGCKLTKDENNNITDIQIDDVNGHVFFMGDSSNSGTGLAELIAEKVWNAVFNDLVDFQKIDENEKIEYGKCYYLGKNGLKMTNSYCQKGVVGIASDTFGLSMGIKFNEKQIPIAVAGWCLAHVKNPETLEQGDPLTSDSNGYLIKISKEDKINYPERIVAIFDRIETKEKWEDVDVKGRSWVKII